MFATRVNKARGREFIYSSYVRARGAQLARRDRLELSGAARKRLNRLHVERAEFRCEL